MSSNQNDDDPQRIFKNALCSLAENARKNESYNKLNTTQHRAVTKSLELRRKQIVTVVS